LEILANKYIYCTLIRPISYLHHLYSALRDTAYILVLHTYCSKTNLFQFLIKTGTETLWDFDYPYKAIRNDRRSFLVHPVQNLLSKVKDPVSSSFEPLQKIYKTEVIYSPLSSMYKLCSEYLNPHRCKCSLFPHLTLKNDEFLPRSPYFTDQTIHTVIHNTNTYTLTSHLISKSQKRDG